MLNRFARAFFTRILTPTAGFLVRRGVSPDAVTLVGTLGVVVGALAFYPRGEFFWGTVFITCFVFSDLIDGTMARMTERSSRWGAWLDSTLDRLGDAAIFSGLVLWFAGDGDDMLLAALALYCLVAGAVVSYTATVSHTAVISTSAAYGLVMNVSLPDDMQLMAGSVRLNAIGTAQFASLTRMRPSSTSPARG